MYRPSRAKQGDQHMPRLQAPNGYYTATEVKKLLNVSDAVVRSYAKHGRIKYVIPPGRKQGFYSKKDVDQIVNEITAFLSMEDNKLKFEPAHKEDLTGITQIANSFFSSEPDEELDDSPIAPDWSYETLRKNPEAEFTLKIGGTLLGFVGTLPLRANIEEDEAKWHKLLTEDRIANIGLTPEDIEKFESGKHIHLFVTGIGIDKNLQEKTRREFGARLVAKFVRKVVELGERGIIIDKVTAGGATPAGIRLLLAFGLHEIPAREPKHRIFTMNVAESGSPAAMQYKKALVQWQQEHS